MSAPADLHGPRDRGPSGVGVRQGLPVQGKLRPCTRACDRVLSPLMFTLLPPRHLTSHWKKDFISC